MNTMSLMRRFTIRLRMLGAIGMVLFLVGLLGMGALWGMARIQSLSDHFMVHSFSEVQKFSLLQQTLGQVRQAEKEMIIQYEKPAEVEKAYGRWKEQLAIADRTAAGFLEGEEDEDNPLIRKVQERLVAYSSAFEGIAAQLKAGGYDSATVANRLSVKAQDEMVEVYRLLGQVNKILQDEVNESIQEQKAASTLTQEVFMVALLAAVAVVVPLTILNMNSICKPLEQARNAALGIAGGDLSQRMRVDGGDEAADLLRALMSMQDGLGSLVAKVRDTSESVALASQEIASGNQDLSQRTEQTASSVQNTVTSLSELTGSVQQSAASAQTANQLSEQVSVLATRSGQVVTQAMGSMQDISTSSHKIGDIIGLIDAIAFQTNILALNAAVEAARAGEQGRGFAVVASEVRALAQRSASAANEIKGLISTSVAAVDGGVRLVQEASNAMQEMVAGVQRVGQIIGEISASASEQSLGIGQVNQSVGDIDQMTQQNAALVEQSAAAADSLREQAALLSQVVHQFRLKA